MGRSCLLGAKVGSDGGKSVSVWADQLPEKAATALDSFVPYIGTNCRVAARLRPAVFSVMCIIGSGNYSLDPSSYSVVSTEFLLRLVFENFSGKSPPPLRFCVSKLLDDYRARSVQ